MFSLVNGRGRCISTVSLIRPSCRSGSRSIVTKFPTAHGRVNRRGVQAAAANEWGVSAVARLHAARRDTLRHPHCSRRCAALADISERWDKGYGHFTTRQNIQFNWPKTGRTRPIFSRRWRRPDLHAIQTSGNTIRNVTTDQFAGAALDEVGGPQALRGVDPPVVDRSSRSSSSCPENSRSRSARVQEDRALVRAHDIGLRLVAGFVGSGV